MLLVPGFGLWYGLRDTGPKDDLGRLQGEWKITPAGAPGKDDGPPLLIRIEGDRWSHVVGDEVVTTWRLALDPDANPKRLDLTLIERNGRPVPAERSGPEPKLLGIYALDGDTLRWAQNPATAPDGRPKSLDDPEAMVLTLTRVKK
ncbi:MAG TPA: TIGR03067 domain-containing protein [Gemmataceae bacterium]|nr:TIGR03067 domain-containing protein [Gemmataceae bacterium]